MLTPYDNSPGWCCGQYVYSVKVNSSWAKLLPEYRSAFLGWSAAGEFHCPCCGDSIGKNLKGEKPHGLAIQHMVTHANKKEL